MAVENNEGKMKQTFVSSSGMWGPKTVAQAERGTWQNDKLWVVKVLPERRD
jgi:hypothetical protein